MCSKERTAELRVLALCLPLYFLSFVSSLFLTIESFAEISREEVEEGWRICSRTSEFLLGSLQHSFKAFLPLTALPAWLGAQAFKAILSFDFEFVFFFCFII